MVERLGVTGDAGSVDVLVSCPFYLYPSFLTLTLHPAGQRFLPRIHPLMRLAHKIGRRSFLPCTIKPNSGFGSAGGYHGGVGAWVGVFDDDSENIDAVWKEMGWDEARCGCGDGCGDGDEGG